MAGAYENMAMYDVGAPILQQEWGAPLGPGKQSDSSPGVYRREFEKATITLDCTTWTSTTFAPK